MPDPKAVTRKFFEEADRGRTAVELCAPGFTAHFPGLPPMDVEAFNEFETTIRSAFSDIRHLIEDLVAEGDTVAVRLLFEGAHTGEFMGARASGQRFSVEGTAVLRMAGNKIAEFWGFLDQLGLMQQIGALPVPGGSPDTR